MRVGVRELILGSMLLVCGMVLPAQAWFVDNFDGPSVDTGVWSLCQDLYNDPAQGGYDWHPVACTWTTSDGSLFRDNTRPSMLTAQFTPVTFAENPVIHVQTRIKSLSSYNFEIDGIGQAGKKFSAYLNANLQWAGSFPPAGTGYLLSPFFDGGPSGSARPTDDWFNVDIKIDKTTNFVGMYINGTLMCSSIETGWLAGLSQIDTLTMTAAGVDASNPWSIDYVRVVPEPATMALLALGGLLLRKKS